MQLISLWVEDFKNLKNFTINFENQENLSIIIGNNGSGKSNILELLSGIFGELYASRQTHIIRTQYSLKYKINNKLVEISKNSTSSTCAGIKILAFNIKYKVDDAIKYKKYLKDNNLMPSRAVALYSGEEIF